MSKWFVRQSISFTLILSLMSPALAQVDALHGPAIDSSLAGAPSIEEELFKLPPMGDGFEPYTISPEMFDEEGVDLTSAKGGEISNEEAHDTEMPTTALTTSSDSVACKDEVTVGLQPEANAVAKIVCQDNETDPAKKCQCLKRFFADDQATAKASRNTLMQVGFQFQLNQMYKLYAANIRASLSAENAHPGDVPISEAIQSAPIECRPKSLMEKLSETMKDPSCKGETEPFKKALSSTLGYDPLTDEDDANESFIRSLRVAEKRERFYADIDSREKAASSMAHENDFVDCMNSSVKKALAVAPLDYPMGSMARRGKELIPNTPAEIKKKAAERDEKLSKFIGELEKWNSDPGKSVRDVLDGSPATETYFRHAFQIFPGMQKLLEIYSSHLENSGDKAARDSKKKKTLSQLIGFFKLIQTNAKEKLTPDAYLVKVSRGVYDIEQFIHEQLNQEALQNSKMGYNDEVTNSCGALISDVKKMACEPASFITNAPFMHRAFSDARQKKQMDEKYVSVWSCGSPRNPEITNTCKGYDLARCSMESPVNKTTNSMLPDSNRQLGLGELWILSDMQSLQAAEEGAVLHMCDNYNKYLREVKCRNFEKKRLAGDKNDFLVCATLERKLDDEGYNAYLKQRGIKNDPAQAALREGFGAVSQREKVMNEARVEKNLARVAASRNGQRTQVSAQANSTDIVRNAPAQRPLAPRAGFASAVSSTAQIPVSEAIVENERRLEESNTRVAEIASTMRNSTEEELASIPSGSDKSLLDELRQQLADQQAQSQKLAEELKALKERQTAEVAAAQQATQPRVGENEVDHTAASNVARAPASTGMASFSSPAFAEAALNPITDNRMFTAPPIRTLQQALGSKIEGEAIPIGAKKSVALKSVMSLDVDDLSNEEQLKALILKKAKELKLADGQATVELWDKNAKEARIVVVEIAGETVSFVKANVNELSIYSKLEETRARKTPHLSFAQLKEHLKRH